MSYKINILSNKDFDELPVSATRGSDISGSLGFANPYTNNVYVRHIAIPALQNYLIDHELEHLIEEHKTDMDENGICHKGFFDVVKAIVNPLNIGGVLGLGTDRPSKGLFNTSVSNPINTVANAVGGTLGGFIPGGGLLGNVANTQKPGAIAPSGGMGQPGMPFQPTGMNTLFPSGGVSGNSFGPGFGQAGAPASATLGPAQSGGLGLGQMGLGQGGIQMGAGYFNREQPFGQSQNQSGYYYPNMGQGNLRF